MAEVTGTIRNLTYYSPDTGFTVARLDVEASRGVRLAGQAPLTIVGILPPVKTGDSVQVTGTLEQHKAYGPQFRVASLSMDLPVTEDGIARFLGSGLFKGLGPATARTIVQAWGTKALDMLDADPARLAEIPGFGPRKVERITEAWKRNQSTRSLMLLLQEFGLSLLMAKRIHAEMGPGAADRIKRNPFLLCSIAGIGFKRADAIAARIGIQGDMYERVEAGLHYTLDLALNQGHAYLTGAELVQRTGQLVRAQPERVQECLLQMLGQEQAMAACAPGGGRFLPRWQEPSLYLPAAGQPDAADPAAPPAATAPALNWSELTVYLPWVYQCENGLAANLARLLWRTTPLARRMARYNWNGYWARSAQELPLTDLQKRAVQAAAQSPFAVLTGGPGTGKTTTIHALLDLCRALKRTALLAAPTGRAAKRMQETTGQPARTVHRLLEATAASGSMRFHRDDSSPLEGDVLIVDEASMLDLHLAYHLSKAIPDHMHVLWVGDVDQLPSVGAGNVLQDIIHAIESEAADWAAAAHRPQVVRLDEIHRQSQDSAIVTNAHRIRKGDMPLIQNGRFKDFFFLPESDPERAQALCLQLARERLPTYFGIEPHEIMVLSPMRRGAVGVEALNQALQAGLNPADKNPDCLRQGDMILRPGDPVMQVRNDYDKMVYNGDLGMLASVDPEKGEASVRFEERIVPYTAQELPKITLAYAVTIHKSQGSEYPAVILPLMNAHYIMLQRNLLYTALTRAKRLVVIVGQRAALHRAVGNAQVAERNSALYASLMHPQEPWPVTHVRSAGSPAPAYSHFSEERFFHV